MAWFVLNKRVARFSYGLGRVTKKEVVLWIWYHGEHYHCVERYSGPFQRVFQLPSGVKTDIIEATFDKGVLKVILPKVEEAKKKQIDIKVQ